MNTQEEGKGPVEGEGDERSLGGDEQGIEKRDTMARFSTPIRLSPPTTKSKPTNDWHAFY